MKNQSVLFCCLIVITIFTWWGCVQECASCKDVTFQDCPELCDNKIPNELIVLLKEFGQNDTIPTIEEIKGELNLRFDLDTAGVVTTDTCLCNAMILFKFPDTPENRVRLNETVADARTSARDEGDIKAISFNRHIRLGPFKTSESGTVFIRGYDPPVVIPETTEEPIIVGVDDSGIAAAHELLRPYLWKNPAALDETEDASNCVEDDLIGYNFFGSNNDLRDFIGHGTHIQGIITKDLPASLPMPIRLFNAKFIENSAGGGNLFDAICGILYLIDIDHLYVINLSFGFYAKDNRNLDVAVLEEALARAGNKNVLIVASVGNDNKDVTCCAHWPSNFSASMGHVISVAALDDLTGPYPDRLACYSNYGNIVDVAAPGTCIESAYPRERVWPEETIVTGTAVMSGTSMAVPHVVSIAAMMFANNPDLSAEQVKEDLINISRAYIIDDSYKNIAEDHGWISH